MYYLTYTPEELKSEQITLCKNVRTVQENLGKTNIEMAAYFDVSESNYYRYLNGEVNMPISRCIKFAKTIGADANFLFYGNPSDKIFLSPDTLQANNIEYHLVNLRSQVLVEKNLMSTSERMKAANQIFELGVMITE